MLGAKIHTGPLPSIQFAVDSNNEFDDKTTQATYDNKSIVGWVVGGDDDGKTVHILPNGVIVIMNKDPVAA